MTPNPREAPDPAADQTPSEEAALSFAPAVIPRTPAPLGADPATIISWFDAVADVEAPVLDGSLAAEREAAEAYARMAKAENTRRAYRAAVRAWCAWCQTRDGRVPGRGVGGGHRGDPG